MLNGKRKQWVIIKGSHLLWSKRKRHIEDDKQIEQRRRFDGWINVMNIGSITKWKGKQKGNHSFAVIIAGSSKAYVWTTTCMKQRDDWVTEIKSHYQHLMRRLDEKTYLKKK